MRIIPLLLLALLAACGRGVAWEKDAPAKTAAADSQAALPLAPRRGDSVDVVAHVDDVAVENVWWRNGSYARIHEGRVRVRDRVVLADAESAGMELVAYWPLDDARTLILLGSNFGGTACDRTFRVVEVTPDTTYVTDSFGTCEWMPDSMWFDRTGGLRMRFPDWAPMRVLLEEGDDYVPGPPTTYVYRGRGRVDGHVSAR